MEKSEVILLLVNLWTEEEINSFKDKDLSGNDYSFKEQIEDRYRKHLVTYLSLEVIKEHQSKWVERYRPLINEKTKTAIRNLFIDQLENTVFVTSVSLDLHEITISNLKHNLKAKEKGTLWAIQEIIKNIDKDVYDSLSINLEGTSFTLEEQLKARWNNTWFFENKKVFKEEIDINNDYSPNSLSQVKDLISLDSFLLKMDNYFLVPPSKFSWYIYCLIWWLIKRSKWLSKGHFLPTHLFFSMFILLNSTILWVGVSMAG